MKQLLVAIAAFAAVATANAYELRINLGNNHATAAGESHQAFNYGATFLMSAEGGWGGYIHMQPKKEEGNAVIFEQATQIGGLYQVNFFSNNDFKAYMAPGIVATMAKDTAADDDYTGFGVGLKTGIQWKATAAFELGLEHTIATNWTEKKMSATPVDAYALTFGFHF